MVMCINAAQLTKNLCLKSMHSVNVLRLCCRSVSLQIFFNTTLFSEFVGPLLGGVLTQFTDFPTASMVGQFCLTYVHFKYLFLQLFGQVIVAYVSHIVSKHE